MLGVTRVTANARPIGPVTASTYCGNCERSATTTSSVCRDTLATGDQSTGRSGEPGRELVVHLLERAREHPSRADHGDEIGVSRPPWDGVQVDVLGDPRTAGRAEVHPEVHPVAVEPLLEHPHGGACE